MTDEAPVPRLRRDPNPTPTNGRKVLVGVAIFFVLLVGFVLTLVFTIGVHNNGVKLPSSPAASASPTSAAAGRVPPFFAIDAMTGAAARVSREAVARVQHHHDRAVALGTSPGGNAAYFAVPKPHCQTLIESLRATSKKVVLSDVTTLSARVLPDPMAVSGDGKLLALVATLRSSDRSHCAPTADTYVLDLHSHRLVYFGKAALRLPVSLTWVPGIGLASLVDGTVVERRLGCPSCGPLFIGDGGGPLGALLMWNGQLAVVTDGTIRQVLGTGPGPVLATGLPQSVVSVSTDPGGTRLLAWGGLQTVKDPGHISFRTTYVWSAGKSTYIPGEWIDPAW